MRNRVTRPADALLKAFCGDYFYSLMGYPQSNIQKDYSIYYFLGLRSKYLKKN